MMTSSPIRIAMSVCWLGCLLLSCTSAVDLRYFNIRESAIGGEPGRRPDAMFALAVGVENFRSAPSLRRQEIILRDGDKLRLTLSSNQLWWALPEEMVSESFKNYLTARNVFRHVFPYPTSHTVRYYFEGTVKTFEIETQPRQWKSRVALEVYLVSQERHDIAWASGIVEATRDCTPSMDDAADKMGECVRQICADITARLAEELPPLKRVDHAGDRR